MSSCFEKWLHTLQGPGQNENMGSLLKSTKNFKGVPILAQWLTNPTRNHEVTGSIPGLTQWVNDLALP